MRLFLQRDELVVKTANYPGGDLQQLVITQTYYKLTSALMSYGDAALATLQCTTRLIYMVLWFLN